MVTMFRNNYEALPSIICHRRAVEGRPCGKCDLCDLQTRIHNTKSWFTRVGRRHQLCFVARLVVLMTENTHALQNIVKLLAPAQAHDAQYALARTVFHGSIQDSPLRIPPFLTIERLHDLMEDSWTWFCAVNSWSQSCFLVALLAEADLPLARLVRSQVERLIAIQETDLDGGLKRLKREAGALWKLVAPSVRWDFVSDLPGNLRRRILAFLDKDSLAACAEPSHPWHDVAVSVLGQKLPCAQAPSTIKEVKKPGRIITRREDLTDLSLIESKSTVSSPIRIPTSELKANFAKDLFVAVPRVDPITMAPAILAPDENQYAVPEGVYFKAAFQGMETRRILMEVRNVFCGKYSSFALLTQKDLTRTIHHDGGPLVAVGGLDRQLRFLNVRRLGQATLQMRGHAGSIRCIQLVHRDRLVFTGSYDATVRCWSTNTGRCRKIFLGHRDTVLCLAVYEDQLAAGSKDGRTTLFNHQRRKFLHSFRDKHPVTAVALSCAVCVTGCKRGHVRVFLLQTGKLIKQLNGHKRIVKSLQADRWFIISGSKDTTVRVWSAVGTIRKCLTIMEHPLEVTHVEMLFLRVLSSCWDGVIRVWNMENGHLLRELFPVEPGLMSPILSFHPGAHWIVVNTVHNVLVMDFEPVVWEYHLEGEGVGPPLMEETIPEPVDLQALRRSAKGVRLPVTPRRIVSRFPVARRASRLLATVKRSLTSHALQRVRERLRGLTEAESKDWSMRRVSSWAYGLQPPRLDISLDKAKMLLWSQFRAPLAKTPPDPLPCIVDRFKQSERLRMSGRKKSRLISSSSVDRLLEPGVYPLVDQRAQQLRDFLYIRREQRRKTEDSLWSTDLNGEADSPWKRRRKVVLTETHEIKGSLASYVAWDTLVPSCTKGSKRGKDDGSKRVVGDSSRRVTCSVNVETDDLRRIAQPSLRVAVSSDLASRVEPAYKESEMLPFPPSRREPLFTTTGGICVETPWRFGTPPIPILPRPIIERRRVSFSAPVDLHLHPNPPNRIVHTFTKSNTPKA